MLALFQDINSQPYYQKADSNYNSIRTERAEDEYSDTKEVLLLNDAGKEIGKAKLSKFNGEYVIRVYKHEFKVELLNESAKLNFLLLKEAIQHQINLIYIKVNKPIDINDQCKSQSFFIKKFLNTIKKYYFSSIFQTFV